MLDACGQVGGLRVLDLGCGHGYLSRLLARAGARVIGVDLADKLLARASEIEKAEPLGIEYRHLNATAVATAFDEASFDLVAGCMSLQDMSDPQAAISGSARLLRPAGRAVFSVPHPCTDPPVREWRRDERGNKLALCLDRYFEAGPAACHWSMAKLKYAWTTPCHRFTLTQWSAMIRQASFTIHGLIEPRPTAAMLAVHPELDDCSRMPYFLIFQLGHLD